ncbi:hypothetical protein BH10PSE14_BH10PSE14_39850 [soil metagenome]
MKLRLLGRTALCGVVLGTALSAASPAAGPPQLAVLAEVEPGQWQLRESGTTAAPRGLCLADPAMLLQLGHPGAQCSRFVINDTPGSATVHYTCPGAGHGRTTLSVETPRVVHVVTQGIAGGLPFDHDYEARRLGACAR